MKKSILIVALVIAALTVAGVGVVYAQGGTPNGGWGGMMQNGQGVLHTYIVNAFAEKLDLTVEDINTRLAAGETMSDIAASTGIKAEDFPALMLEVRSDALDAAVAAGVITQEQADWMLSRGFGRGGMGNGTCTGDGAQNGAQGGGHGMMGLNGRWSNPKINP